MISRWHEQLSGFSNPRSEPSCAIWLSSHQINLTFGRRTERRANIPHAADGAQENGTILRLGLLGHGFVRSVRLDPPELRKFWKIGENGWRPPQAVFITAPSMTMPAVTYFHSATRSLRASATMVAFLRRPPLRLTRS